MSLPNTYWQLDYIESSGTQYIDSGVSLNTNSKIETRLKWGTQSTTWAVFFGMTNNDNSSNGILARIYSSTSTIINPWFLNSTYGERQITTTLNTYHDVVMQKNKITFDSTDYSITTSGTAYSGNMFIFCGNNMGSAWRYSSMTLSYMKIYDNETLVRDFIPAMQKSDEVVGLYDLVNDVFYTNSGSGTFSYGTIYYTLETNVSPSGAGTISDVRTDNDHVITATKQGLYKFNYWTLNGYTQLDYIESSGTQYIDTGYIPQATYFKLGIDFEASILSGGLFGCSNIGGSTRYNFASYIDNAFMVYCGTSSNYANVNISANTRYNFVCEANNGTQTIKDDTSTLSTRTYSGTLRQTGNYTFPLFARRESEYYFASAKIYSVKMYEDSTTLVRDYIPVIRHTDGQVGLYDLVNHKFYGNRGTGCFGAGGIS